MAHSYASEYPSDSSVNSGIRDFFEAFYKISDTGPEEESHQSYADQFTNDATLVMASKVGKGRDGELVFITILTLITVANNLSQPIIKRIMHHRHGGITIKNQRELTPPEQRS